MSETVGVLITCYNGQAHLPECLESLRAQTHGQLEVLVVDDGSQDDSALVIRQYAAKDARIGGHFLTQNLGVPAAANEGLKHLNTPWIARIDADDKMHPTRLEAQLNEARTTGGLVGSRVELFGQTTEGQQSYINWSNGLLRPKQIATGAYKELPLPHPSWLAPKALFDQLAYRQMDWAEDYDLFMRALQAGWPISKLNQTLTYKRELPRSLSATSPAYKRPAMFAAKAHFLSRSGLGQGRPWLVFGSGPSGKLAAKALLSEGVDLAGFVDNVSGKGRQVLGLPVTHLSPGGQQLGPLKEYFKVLCIGQQSAKNAVVKLLEAQGESEGQHWIALL